MKIAFYTDTYLPNKDGVVVSIINFRKELEKRGHEVRIFASGTKKAKKENKDESVEIHSGLEFRPYPAYKIAYFPFLSERTVRKTGIEMIHSHGMASMGLAADRAAHDLNLPYVGALHTLIPNATHYISQNSTIKQFAEKMAWEYLRIFYNRCDVATAPSDTIREIMEEHGIRNVRTLPNGVDLEKFKPVEDGNKIRKRHGLVGKRVVLHVGRLVLEKNLGVMIKGAKLIAAKDKDVRFLVVGTGPSSRHYEELAKKEGVSKNFIFAGFVKDDEILDYYAAADICAVPSNFETQGLVTLESMACGKPVAGADYLATKEIVKNGKNGYLFDPDDPIDCAEKIMETLNAKNKLKTGAFATAKKYSVQKCTDRLLDLYEELIEKKKKRRR